MSFNWTAPTEGSGYVGFRFAVVQTTTLYWADQDGGTLLGGLACSTHFVGLSAHVIQWSDEKLYMNLITRYEITIREPEGL